MGEAVLVQPMVERMRVAVYYPSQERCLAEQLRSEAFLKENVAARHIRSAMSSPADFDALCATVRFLTRFPLQAYVNRAVANAYTEQRASLLAFTSNAESLRKAPYWTEAGAGVWGLAGFSLMSLGEGCMMGDGSLHFPAGMGQVAGGALVYSARILGMFREHEKARKRVHEDMRNLYTLFQHAYK